MVAGNRTDGELIREFVAAGNEAAFEEVVRRHGPMVLSICQRVLGRRHDAEDLMQVVFMTLAQKAESLVDRPSLAGWLHRVAWHVSVRHRRATLLRRHHEHKASEIWFRIKLNGNDSDDLAIELDRALNLLREEFREPLILHHVQGHTIEEAAELMDCKVGTVASRLARGREMLRERLERWGLVLTVAVTGQLLLTGAGPGGAVQAPIAAAPAAMGGVGWNALAASTSASPVAAATATAGVVTIADFFGVRSTWAKCLMGILVSSTIGSTTLASMQIYSTIVEQKGVAVAPVEYRLAASPAPAEADSEFNFNFGGSSGGVPEPGSLSLLAAASLLLLRRRQSSRRDHGDSCIPRRVEEATG